MPNAPTETLTPQSARQETERQLQTRIPRSTWYRIIQTHALPATRVGGRWKITPQALKEFLTACKQGIRS